MIKTEFTTLDFVERINDVARYYNNLPINPRPRERQNINRDYKQEYPKIEEVAENLSVSYETNYFNEMRKSFYKKINFSTAEYYNSTIGRVEIKIAAYLTNSQIVKDTEEAILKVIGKLRRYAREQLMESFTKEYIEKTF